MNLAQNGRVVWGNAVDYGPGGGAGLTTPTGHRLPGQFHNGARILIPVPAAGGSFDVQVWGGFVNGDLIEWGRVNAFGQPAFIRNIEVPPKPTGPPPPPPAGPTASATRAAMIASAKEWQDAQRADTPLARITNARLILEMPDSVWNRVREQVSGLTHGGTSE